MTVSGRLDETGSRALLDAVAAAIDDRGAVIVELEVTEGLCGETIRNLAACASRGALLCFHPTHPRTTETSTQP
jgi:hypothetical protein